MAETKTLAELRSANLARAACADVLKVSVTMKAGVDPIKAEAERADVVAALDAYLAPFVKPNDDRCVMCGSELSGIFGSFMWGIVHGEGECSHCRYPARAYHYVKIDVDGEPAEFRTSFVLQYHPSELSTPEERAARAAVESK
jgi:hypothetical protein